MRKTLLCICSLLAGLSIHAQNTAVSNLDKVYAQYFTDAIYSELKPEVTSNEGIDDATLKTLVGNLLKDKEGYSKFRVGEYEPYLTTGTLWDILKVSASYNKYENPTGIYLKAGETCFIAVEGINSRYPVGLTIKNWFKNEHSSSYSLSNGLNKITASTEGNVFVKYYTDDFETAPNVKVHFINAPVQGYWDQATMTNEDWVKMLEGRTSKDSTIIITRSEHAQLAYPVALWLTHCPTNIDSTMTLYQQVQWAQRDILGLEKYGRQVKNRQLYYATNYGFMAAGGEGAYCNVTSLGAIMVPDSKKFDLWGVGHEWGHNNQVTPGFKWPGCGETTNNIYAAWGQIHFTGNRGYLRLEDETSGIDEYSGMRGGRMQTYFEEGLRKGVSWQLQDGPDYHGATPEVKKVNGEDANGNSIGMVTTTSRNYDHFVKLAPFWQLNLWGTLAGKCPDIIPMVIESIRTTSNYGSKYNTSGKQQINWMKLACDSAKIDLLPFFEKAGMLRPIHAYIEDYGKGWNIITEEMIAELKAYVKEQNYPAFTEEINYINGHNYHIYRDSLELETPKTMGDGCVAQGDKMQVYHNQVKNAVAFETYNFKGELIRITMYGLGSNDSHSFTQVLCPKDSRDAKLSTAYIMAVGYDGKRVKIYQEEDPEAIYKRECLNLLDEGKKFQDKTDTTGSQIGYFFPDALTEFTALINRIDSLIKNTNESTHDYRGWYAQIEEAIDALYANTSTRVPLIQNNMYSIKSNTGLYVSINTANELSAIEKKSEALSDSMQWRFISAEKEGTYYIMNRATGKYITSLPSGKRVKAESNDISEAVVFTLEIEAPGEFHIQSASNKDLRMYTLQNTKVHSGNQTGNNAKWSIQLEDNLLALPKTSSDDLLTAYQLIRNDNSEQAYSYISKMSVDNGRIITETSGATTDFNYLFYFRQGSQEGKYTIYSCATGKPVTIDDNGLYINKNAEIIPEFAIALNEEGTGLTISSEKGSWSMQRASTMDALGLSTEGGLDWKLQRVGNIVPTLTSITIVNEKDEDTPITEAKLFEGESITLIANTAPIFATGHSMTWSSSDEAVAVVEPTGKVTAIAEGNATITITGVTSEGKEVKATCKITVKKNLLTKISVTPSKTTLYQGDSITLVVRTLPLTAADHSVTWSSSDESIATVNAETGKVIAIAVGEAIITATANDGSGCTSTCKLTVKAKIETNIDSTISGLQIQSAEGAVIVSGLTEGAVVSIYDTIGQQLATTTATSSTMIINEGFAKGKTIIVIVGTHSAKVQIK